MSKKRKKKYTKPRVTRVKLMSEEAVLGGCKTTNIGGSGVGLCYDSLSPGCFAAGS